MEAALPYLHTFRPSHATCGFPLAVTLLCCEDPRTKAHLILLWRHITLRNDQGTEASSGHLRQVLLHSCHCLRLPRRQPGQNHCVGTCRQEAPSSFLQLSCLSGGSKSDRPAVSTSAVRRCRPPFVNRRTVPPGSRASTLMRLRSEVNSSTASTLNSREAPCASTAT